MHALNVRASEVHTSVSTRLLLEQRHSVLDLQKLHLKHKGGTACAKVGRTMRHVCTRAAARAVAAIDSLQRDIKRTRNLGRAAAITCEQRDGGEGGNGARCDATRARALRRRRRREMRGP